MTGARHFDQVVAQMPDLLQELQATPKDRVNCHHPAIPNAPGIYLFSEDARPVYVGQSRKLRSRIRQHVGANSDHYSASFAFLIARRDAAAAGVDVDRWRNTLVADPAFAEHFAAARAQVAAMDVQYISVPDPIARTMFEMLHPRSALDTTEFNSFETH